jgi:hypothetical protein
MKTPVVEATRQILFELHPRIGLNVGILLAWCGIGTFLYPFTCYYMRWNTARQKKHAAEKEKAWDAKMEQEQRRPSFLGRVTTLGERPPRDDEKKGKGGSAGV